MTRNIAIIAGIAVLVFLGGLFIATRVAGPEDPFAQCRASVVAGGNAQIGGPFTLVSETGETVTDKDVIDQPALIYFGYTFCPDVCPVDAARNAEAATLLEERGVRVKPVFITIDPKRDTAEVLTEFTDFLHPRMLGLTGSPEQIEAATKAYRAYAKINDSEDEEFYLVDHSTQTYLMLPEHGFVAFFKRADTAEQIADRVQCFAEGA